MVVNTLIAIWGDCFPCFTEKWLHFQAKQLALKVTVTAKWQWRRWQQGSCLPARIWAVAQHQRSRSNLLCLGTSAWGFSSLRTVMGMTWMKPWLASPWHSYELNRKGKCLPWELQVLSTSPLGLCWVWALREVIGSCPYIVQFREYWPWRSPWVYVPQFLTLRSDQDTYNLDVDSHQLPRLCYTIFKGQLASYKQTDLWDSKTSFIRRWLIRQSSGRQLENKEAMSKAEEGMEKPTHSAHRKCHRTSSGAIYSHSTWFIISLFTCFPDHYRLEAANKTQERSEVKY